MKEIRSRVRLVARAASVITQTTRFGAHTWWLTRSLRGSAREEAWYRRTPVLATRLGPTYLKLAQILATRRDVIPRSLCDELSRLHDDVPAMSETELEQALREQYPEGVDAAFADFDRTPVASGSIACVYRAHSSEGREVAVKLRRPRVEQTMSDDLRLLLGMVRLAQRWPSLSRVPLGEIVTQVSDVLLAQANLDRERESLVALRENLSAIPRIWVPRVYGDHCRSGSLVTEFISGLQDQNMSAGHMKRRQFADSALTAIYHMLFLDGLVHCDMHPGNLYFLSSGQVVVLDAGFSVQLEDRVRLLFADFFLNMALGRGERAARIVVESSQGLEQGANVDGFVSAMGELVERSHGQSAREFSLIQFATEMFDLQRRFGIKSAPEIVFPLLALLVIEGTIRDLNPEVDFQEAAKPLLHRALFAKH